MEAPALMPTLNPRTVNGYLRWRKVRTPLPPPAPTAKPAFTTGTRTVPVIACDGRLKPIDMASTASASRIIVRRFHIHSVLLRQKHCEVAEHREQDAGHGVADRKTDPRDRTLDFHRGLTSRT